MSWHIAINTAQFEPGAVLSIFASWGPELPVDPLPSGVSLPIRFADRTLGSIDVIEASGDEMIIQVNDRQWHMMRVARASLPVPPANSGLPATYWKVTGPIRYQSWQR